MNKVISQNYISLRSLYQNMEQTFMTLTPPPFNQNSLNDLAKNIPVSGNQRQPGECDTLSFFVKTADDQHMSFINRVIEEVKLKLPEVEWYPTPDGTFHIGLKMLYDLRPIDMAKPELLPSIFNQDKLNRLFDSIKDFSFPNYKLLLHKFLFSPNDGSVIAVFLDNGETSLLRKCLGEKVDHLQDQQFLKYPKNIIHMTCLRQFQQWNTSMLEIAKGIQQNLFIENKIELPVNRFFLGHENKWLHTDMDILKTFPLK